MTSNSHRSTRRTFLRLAGATTLGVSIAGCTALGGNGGDDGLVLEPPANHDRVSNADIPHPIYGEELPSVTVPATQRDRAVTTTEFVGDRHVLLTFVYTTCTTVCPGLTAALRHVQADAADRGYADEVALMAVTFDPERDTPAVLRDYGASLGVDYDAGNWYFLRPETPADARSVVTDAFGVAYERADGAAPDTEDDSHDAGGDHDHVADAEDTDDAHDGHDATHDHHYVHTSLILVVNRDGVVERAYTGGSPGPAAVIEDARALVEGW